MKSRIFAVLALCMGLTLALTWAVVTYGSAQSVELVTQVGGSTYAVAVQGNYAYIGVGPRLVILDVSNPAHPTIAGQTGILSNIVRGLAVAGNYVYVADGNSLRVFNVSNPAAPAQVGSYSTSAEKIVMVGNYAYVAAGGSGLRIIDISNPTSPTQVGYYAPWPSDVSDVAVAGSYAYLADRQNGLVIVSISNPAAPVRVGSYDPPGFTETVAVSGDYAYISVMGEHTWVTELRVVNVANKSTPGEIGTYTPWDRISDSTVDGNYIYLVFGFQGRGKGLEILNVSNPSLPTQVSLRSFQEDLWAITMANSYIYLGGNGLHVINAADPAAPTQIGAYSTIGPIDHIATAGAYAYVGSSGTGLQVLNIANPIFPFKISSYPGGCVLADIAVSGSYAYVADCQLRIFDISDPAGPRLVGTYDTPGQAWGVAVAYPHVYVADGDKGLRIINISNPTAPTEVGFYDTPGYANRVAVIGSHAYVVDGGNLRIINISNPSAPTEVGFYDPPGFLYGVAVVGNYAYVVGEGSGLRIINISNPSAPIEVGFYNAGGYAARVVVAGDYAYVTGWSAGLRIINIADPAHPTEAGFYDTPGYASDVAVLGNSVYVADSDGGLVVLWFAPSVSVSISTSGGSLASPRDSTAYTFPAGTFTDTVVITHTSRSPINAPSLGTLVGIGHVFDLAAAYSSTGQPAQPAPGKTYTVTVQYTDAEKGSAIESTLGLYHWDYNQWMREPTSVVDIAANTVTATPNHFSLWAVLGDAGVDGYVTATSPVSGTIGGYGAVPVSYGNMGTRTASNVVLEAVLGTGLNYATDTSGLAPTVDGNRVQWNLLDLSFMDRQEFRLYVRIPSTATIGMHFPITLTLTSTGPEANPADNTAVVEVAASFPGGPDNFGYTWDDAVPFNWIDATTGIYIGLTGNNQFTGTIEIGFPFRFYENTYTQLYASTNGLVTFGQGASQYSNQSIPNLTPPNNFIAPFWDDLAVGSPYNSGKVYYKQGGPALNRYFVIEWYNVTACCASGATDYKTFEVILYESGDIVMQYLSLSGNLQSATVGTEDDLGVTGLQYLYNAPGLGNSKAVRFYRPTPSARVRVDPSYQSSFTQAGKTVPFQIAIRNTGELGVDTYDLTTSSTWPTSLYAADGVVPLTDTDSDGVVDTGSVIPGDTLTITVKIQTPSTANVGNNNIATITVCSSLDTSKGKTGTLQAAVPAPFAQVFLDSTDGAMSMYLVQPSAQALKKATVDGYSGEYMAVVETPGHNFVYAWNKYRCLDSSCNIYVREVEYTLLNRYGEIVRAVSKLTDHSGATMRTQDYRPAVAVTPDGRVGMLWYRYLYNSSTSQLNYNIYLAILDVSGNLVYGPLNLTNNTVWGKSGDLNVPSFSSPRIAATTDNRFVLAWRRSNQESAGWVDDIYYAVRDSNGGEVQGLTKFTNDTPGGSEAYYAPNLATLSGNRALLTWQRDSDDDIYYAVLDSSGNTVKAATNLAGDGTSQWDSWPDAVQLSDGKTVVAWTSGSYPNYRTRFAVLDVSYNRIAGPTMLANPAALLGDSYVSLAADAADHAILTWMDYDSSYRRNLYYALVDGNGSVLTPPMIYRTSQAASPRIWSSFDGYGNTSYSWTPPSGVDGWVQAPSLAGTPPAGTAGIQMRYGNHGTTTATSVVLTATLGTGLTYVNDTSGISPTISGNVVTWSLPDIGFLGSGQFMVRVSIPGDPIGTRYPVTLMLSSTGTEANPANNALTLEVMAARQMFLPLIMRNYR